MTGINVKQTDLKTLFEQKLENSIINDQAIALTISNDVMEVRNIVLIENLEYDEDYLCIIDGDYEMHLKFDEIDLEYDNSYNESFTLSNYADENTKVYVEFI